jgi:hypothetical protein
VQRVDAATQVDLSGQWNDTDVRTVSKSLINDILSSASVSKQIKDYSAKNKGALPAVIVGEFRNTSSEHIDTSIISKMLETEIINSGQLEFVAGGDTRAQLRDERYAQEVHASEATASAFANETGAVFMLTGSVKSMVDSAANRTMRTYYVDAQLASIETTRIVWQGQNSDIKKIVTQSKVKL